MFDPYLELLKRQVEEEIAYLTSIGHDVKHPVKPCVFCNEYKGVNMCTRMNELRDFKLRINIQLKSHPIAPELPVIANSNSLPVIGFDSNSL
jgi:hypothetical protein